jgi:hypothetical protein
MSRWYSFAGTQVLSCPGPRQPNTIQSVFNSCGRLDVDARDGSARDDCANAGMLVQLASVIRLNSRLPLQVNTERKSPRKPGDNVLFMEHLVVPYHNTQRDVLKVCWTVQMGSWRTAASFGTVQASRLISRKTFPRAVRITASFTWR